MTTTTPNVVLSLVGREGSGKTQFGLTAPKPIACISTDTNTRATAATYFKLADGEDFDPGVFRLKQVSLPSLVFNDRDAVKEEAESKWDEIRDYLEPMYRNKSDRPKTLMLDTAADVFDMLVLGAFGKLDQITPETRRNMMGRCNTSYKGIVQAFKDIGVHVVLVHRAKDKWVDKEQRTQRGLEDVRTMLTGSFDQEREGFKGTGFITNAEVFLAFDPDRDGKLSAKYGMKIIRSQSRPGVIGKEYWGREKNGDGSRIARASFPYLATQLYPATSIENWR